MVSVQPLSADIDPDIFVRDDHNGKIAPVVKKSLTTDF